MRAEINRKLKELLENPKVILLGQSIRDPYGGAAKVTRGLSTKFPNQVIDMPISESAMIGTALGLAYKGFIPIVEIMFFDFMTLCADQLFNIGGKLDKVHGVDFKVIIRTMQAPPEYGPTHSQDMRELLKALDIAWITLGDSTDIYDTAILMKNKIVVIIETKNLY